MATPRVIYSFVVDGGEAFRYQAFIFCRTLLSTGTPADSVFAQLTPSAWGDSALLSMLQAFGVRTASIHPFLDGKYCNKLNQLDNLPLDQAEFVALCDTDLAFLEPVNAVVKPGTIRSKPVDEPNPPLPLLIEAMRRCHIVAQPKLTQTSINGEPTFAANCNGGLYLLPSAMAPPIAATWKVMASRLFEQSSFLDRFAVHVDQIAFAMTMLELGLDVDELPIEYNFPLHHADRLDPQRHFEPAILHYHWLHDEKRLLNTANRADVRAAVDAVNAILGS